jgi:hypothetical protein
VPSHHLKAPSPAAAAAAANSSESDQHQTQQADEAYVACCNHHLPSLPFITASTAAASGHPALHQVLH